MKKKQVQQAEVNIGVVGHVDHGKTSVVKSLTGEWADRHSEEIKRGVTIKLGYADANFYACDKCEAHKRYTNKAECDNNHDAKFLRTVSFVDCPGHETLMAVMLSGASLMDGAMLVIAANENCPQPQTAEHLYALNISGIKNIVIVQNKIDLVSKEQAKKNYEQIKNFVKGSTAENAPIIPFASHYNVNMDALIEAIENVIKTPPRDTKKDFRMLVARSFDINKPSGDISKLKGGVIGGSVISGVLKEGDEIEICPGIPTKEGYEKITTKAVSLSVKSGFIQSAHPGGLVGVGTLLDPSLTKSDNMIGNIVGKPGTLPAARKEIDISVHLLKEVVDLGEVKPLKKDELIVINIGTATTIGEVIESKGGKAKIKLRKSLCIDKGGKIALSRKSHIRWCLIGYGVIE